MLILDTHALVWLAEGSDRLGPKSRSRCDRASAEGKLAVSAISFWEVAMLSTRGRARFARPIEAWRNDLLSAGLIEVPLVGDIAIAAGQLGGFDGDPADRIIVASAIRIGATLVTADQRMLDWTGALKRFDASR